MRSWKADWNFVEMKKQWQLMQQLNIQIHPTKPLNMFTPKATLFINTIASDGIVNYKIVAKFGIRCDCQDPLWLVIVFVLKKGKGRTAFRTMIILGHWKAINHILVCGLVNASECRTGTRLIMFHKLIIVKQPDPAPEAKLSRYWGIVKGFCLVAVAKQRLQTVWW